MDNNEIINLGCKLNIYEGKIVLCTYTVIEDDTYLAKKT